MSERSRILWRMGRTILQMERRIRSAKRIGPRDGEALSPSPLRYSKFVVHTGAHQARFETVRCAGEIAALAQIEVEILDPRRPVRGEPDLRTDAQRPADVRLRFRKAGGAEFQVAISKAAGAVSQHVIHRVADAAARGAEP